MMDPFSTCFGEITIVKDKIIIHLTEYFVKHLKDMLCFVLALPKTPASSGKKRKSTETLESRSKKARVSFGPKLSPEHFLKTLPPSTPVRKGATPKRPGAGAESLKPLLKRKSIAASQKSPIKEESPFKAKSPGKSPKAGGRSPRSPKEVKSPKANKSSVASPKTPGQNRSTEEKPASPRTKSPSQKKSPQTKPAALKNTPAKSPQAKATPVKTGSPKSPAGSKSPRSKQATPVKSPKNTPKKSRKSSKKSKSVDSMDESFAIGGLFETPNVVTSTPMAGSNKKRRSAVLTKSQSKKKQPVNRRASTGNLDGVKRLMKTPKGLPDTSFTGLSEMMETPKAASAKKTTTPKVKSPKTPAETSYSGIAAMMASPKAKAVSAKKGSPKTIVASPVVKKIDNPMADLRKAVAIRAILGKGATPKMPQVAPKSWADVVKKGKAKKVLTPQARRVVHVKRLGKISKKNLRKVLFLSVLLFH